LTVVDVQSGAFHPAASPFCFLHDIQTLYMLYSVYMSTIYGWLAVSAWASAPSMGAAIACNRLQSDYNGASNAQCRLDLYPPDEWSALMHQKISSQTKPSRGSKKELHRSRGRQIIMATRKFNLDPSILTNTQSPRHLTIPFSPKRINLLQCIQPSSNIDRQRRARFPLGQQRTVMNEGFERP